MSFALAQGSSCVACQQKSGSQRRNVVVAAQRPAVTDRKQQSMIARLGGASLGAAAAALLMASPALAAKGGAVNAEKAAQEQLSGGATNQGYQPSKLADKADNDSNALPLSESRLPKGQPLPGDEAKIREARAALKKEIKGQYADKGMNSKTNTLLDPYGFNQKDKMPLFNGPPQKK